MYWYHVCVAKCTVDYNCSFLTFRNIQDTKLCLRETHCSRNREMLTGVLSTLLRDLVSTVLSVHMSIVNHSCCIARVSAFSAAMPTTSSFELQMSLS